MARHAAATKAASPAPERLQALKPSHPVLIPWLLMLASRITMAWTQPFASEDAYITFRFARNLAEGAGLVYNPGEHVMGFTSPVWTVWCALGFLLHVDPVWWTRLTSIATDAAIIWIAADMLRRRHSETAAWAFTLFFAAWPLFAASAMSGLESNVFLFLIFACAWTIERRSRLAGALLGLLACCRPEGILAAAILGIRADRRTLVVGAALFAAVLLGIGLYFGSVIPQSVVAKAVVYGLPGPMAGKQWWDWLIPFPLGRWPISSEGIHLLPLSMIGLASLVHGVPRAWRERSHPSSSLPVAGASILAGYALTGTTYFWWYLVVPLGCLGFLAAIGFEAVAVNRPLKVVALASILGIWTLALPLYVGRGASEYTNNASVTGVLKQLARPDEQVLLEPIGLVGYETRLRVLDEVGLVTPEVVTRRRSGAGWYADLVTAHWPDWLIVRNEMLDSPNGYAGLSAPFRNEGERAGVLLHYTLVWPPAPIDGIGLRVFRRLAR
jgi:hypothetical protein